MAEPTTLGSWLRRERERRGVTLSQISEQTKVSVSLLEGLEADDLSRWPGGIFRRSFARSYASAIGLDRDLVVRRIDEEHPEEGAEQPAAYNALAESAAAPGTVARVGAASLPPPIPLKTSRQSRLRAALLDLLVALAIGLGFAAGGSRLLWPVLLIAAYHALGLVLVGTSPMAALLADEPEPAVPAPSPAKQVARAPEPAAAPEATRRQEAQHVRRVHRGGRRSGTRDHSHPRNN